MDKKFLEIIYKAPKDTAIKIHEIDGDKLFYQVEEKYCFKSQVVERLDKFIFNSLYKEFLETEASHLVVIDKQEFNKFLMKYLPMYAGEKLYKPLKKNVYMLNGRKYERPYCPVCYNDNIEEGDNYCSECGNKLDWGDENE